MDCIGASLNASRGHLEMHTSLGIFYDGLGFFRQPFGDNAFSKHAHTHTLNKTAQPIANSFNFLAFNTHKVVKQSVSG